MLNLAKKIKTWDNFLFVTLKNEPPLNVWLIGDSDVGDFVMVTAFRCWWQDHYVGDFLRYVGDLLNVN